MKTQLMKSDYFQDEVFSSKAQSGSAAEHLMALSALTDRYESEVRLYSRTFKDVFTKAYGSCIMGHDGKKYLDFLTGAGALNYGHNHPILKKALIDYLMADNVIHCLDMYTAAHVNFVTRFHDIILTPRNMNYKIQFTGPTGANAVEASLKLARAYTGRKRIAYFKGSYHGLSHGALSVSDLEKRRKNALVDFPDTIMFPWGNTDNHVVLLQQLRNKLNGLSEIDLPAAFIIEPIQGEGGINVAPTEWLRSLKALAADFDILFIADEIQTGCGRTGRFFDFERAGIQPDMICLSKSLSGIGLPLAVLLVHHKIDVWEPGEHTGTFRGNNLALVSAAKTLEFWENSQFEKSIAKKSALMDELLDNLVKQFPDQNLRHKGHGLMRGLEWSQDTTAKSVGALSFAEGLIIETCGKRSQVLKLMPALTISQDEMVQGVGIIEKSLHKMLRGKS